MFCKRFWWPLPQTRSSRIQIRVHDICIVSVHLRHQNRLAIVLNFGKKLLTMHDDKEDKPWELMNSRGA